MSLNHRDAARSEEVLPVHEHFVPCDLVLIGRQDLRRPRLVLLRVAGGDVEEALHALLRILRATAIQRRRGIVRAPDGHHRMPPQQCKK